MEALSPRTITDMKPVLYNPEVTAPADVYWVFRDIKREGDKRFDITILTNDLMGQEYPKTYGHYHLPKNAVESYSVISGNALFLFQKPNDQNLGEISEFHAVKKTTGESIDLPAGFAHATINLGPDALVVGNWENSDVENNYDPIKEFGGFAYYVICENGEIKFIKNEAYSVVPEIIDHL